VPPPSVLIRRVDRGSCPGEDLPGVDGGLEDARDHVALIPMVPASSGGMATRAARASAAVAASVRIRMRSAGACEGPSTRTSIFTIWFSDTLAMTQRGESHSVGHPIRLRIGEPSVMQ